MKHGDSNYPNRDPVCGSMSNDLTAAASMLPVCSQFYAKKTLISLYTAMAYTWSYGSTRRRSLVKVQYRPLKKPCF